MPACLARGPSGAHEATYAPRVILTARRRCRGGASSALRGNGGARACSLLITFRFILCPRGVAFSCVMLLAVCIYTYRALPHVGAPCPISAARRRRPAALSRARLPCSGRDSPRRPARASSPWGRAARFTRHNNARVRRSLSRLCHVHVSLLTGRCRPSRLPARSWLYADGVPRPIPRTVLSGLTAGLRQRGLLEASFPSEGVRIHASQRSPLSYT